jgi:hypothetical protein
MTLAVVAGIGLAAGVGVEAYNAYNSSQLSGQASQMAGITQGEQVNAYNQLMQLMSNPSTFFSSPVFQSSLQQGENAVGRNTAAAGFLGSGNQAGSLQAYGQSFGQQQLSAQEQLFASMSGTQSASSGAQNIAAASGAQGQAGNQLGGIVGQLGFLGLLGANSGLFGGGGASVSSYAQGLSQSPGWGVLDTGYTGAMP